MKPTHHRVRVIAGIALAAVVALSVFLATRPTSQATEVQSPLLGKAAPSLIATTLAGSRFDLSSRHGRYTYVNFFASWCPPCQSEEPAFVAFDAQQSRRPDGAGLVSVIYNDTLSDVARYASQWGMRWPIVADDGGSIANRYGVTSPPTTILINPNGMIVGEWTGPVTLEQLDGLLSAAERIDVAHGA